MEMSEFQPLLTDREKEIRNRFAAEYVKYRDPVKAAVRIGYNIGVAREYAVRFMHEAYTLRAIETAEHDILSSESDEGLTAEQRKIKRLLFLEAEERGENAVHGARVSALAKLVSICGMESPIKVETNHAMTHSFDFSQLRKQELEMVRSLLEGRLSDGVESSST